MSRLISKDFDELLDFVRTYSLSEVLENKKFIQVLSTCHKKYFAYLILIEKLHHVKDENKMPESQYDFLQESCSDIGQAFFLLFHGCYKGAKLLLRSSIENFLKGICMDEDSSLSKTKSVYEIFDKAKVTMAFAENKIELHDKIHNTYAILCQDVHTADKTHMSSITALDDFPSFEEEEALIVTDFILSLVPIYITLLAIKFNKFYNEIDSFYKGVTNKEILRDFKKVVHNIA